MPLRLMGGIEGVDRALRRAVPPRAVRGALAVVLLVPQLTGCYQYAPANTTSLPGGSEVSLGVTDRGRVALAERLGPGIRRIDGRVVASTDTSVVIAVTSMQFLDAGGQWTGSGENVEIPHQYLAEVRERQFSAARTYILTGLVIIGGVLASMIAIRGFGDDDPGEKTNGGEPGQQ